MLSRLTQMFKSAPSDPAAPEHIARLEACLDGLVDPNTGHTYRSARSLRPLKTDGDSVTAEVVLAYPAQSCFDAIRQQVSEALAGELGNLWPLAIAMFVILSLPGVALAVFTAWLRRRSR